MRRVVLVGVLFLSLFVGAQTINVTFPDDFTNPDELVGKTLVLNQEFVVSSNSYWERYGELILSTKRRIIPTEIAIPGSAEYEAIAAQNQADQLMIKGEGFLPWADKDGTFRTGAKISNLVGVYTKIKDIYYLNLTQTPIIEYSYRPTEHDDIGDYDLKICSFNLHIYLASDYGTGYGPENEEQAELQHAKLVAAMTNIGADIYGLCEIQTGQGALEKLVNSLNAYFSDRRYDYVNEGDATNGSFTKVGFIYRADKVVPVRNIQANNSAGTANRKKAQGFEVLSSGERFVYFMGHYKAKSGTPSGLDADQGDGQGIYSYTRKQEAVATATFLRSCASYYKDNDILITGDLNAYSQEDPLRVLYDKGYTEMIRYFNGDNSYSYVFAGAIGLLDHALANESMKEQITGVTVYHLNSDEPSIFCYDKMGATNDMYYSSDHDPVIVGVKLKGEKSGVESVLCSSILYGGGEYVGISAEVGSVAYIYNTMGQYLGCEYVTSADYTFATSKYNMRGNVYLVKVVSPNGATQTHKLVVK